MPNLAWQPPKRWTLADCLLVITEATSSAATGISTLLSASWGQAWGVSVLRVGARSCTMLLMWSRVTEKHKAANPHRWPCGEFSHAYLVRK